MSWYAVMAGWAREYQLGRGGMGSLVTITEIDPIKALEAHMGDIFITCTGQTKVIREFLSKNYHNMEDKIYAVPREIDLSVANYALDAVNIKN
jgi:S-adenosylhomocysteine hydrolase